MQQTTILTSFMALNWTLSIHQYRYHHKLGHLVEQQVISCLLYLRHGSFHAHQARLGISWHSDVDHASESDDGSGFDFE